jgi:hypothetical protein
MPQLKLPKPSQPPQPAQVEWLDAAIHPDYDGMAKNSPGRVLLWTCGYFVKATQKEVTIAVDYDPETHDFRTPNVLSRQDIVRFTLLAPASPLKKGKR